MGRSQILRRAVASTLPLPAAFEPLEQRLQMSASAITLSGGVLTLTGMTGTGNTITSSLSGSNLTVKLDGTTKTFAASSVSKIVVTGGTHGDYIKLATNSTIPDIINSGDGNDTIVSGAGNDVIDAGAGTDNVDGGAGYDIALNAESRKNIESTSGSITPTPSPTTGNTPAGVGGSISGLFWGDSNANGAIDAGEPMATARTAFIDKNGNGKLDSGETSTTTDSTGRYTFTNLSAGSYKIGRVFPSGYKISNSTSADLNVVLASAQKITNANIGSIPTSQTPTGSGNTPASATGSISGLFWGDSNANGAIDAGEPMAKARTAFIDKNGNGKLDSGETTATTDSTGRYTFTNLSAGSYKIGRVFPSGYKISNSTSADISVVLASGQKITNANIGSITTSQTPTGSGNTPAGTPTPTPTPTPSPTPTPTPTPTSTVGSSIPVNSSAAKPKPVISLISKNITAGESVFVNGLSTTVGAGSIDTARLEWNFGDASGKYNSLVGFSAGHVYDKPGAYTLTLKVWNQNNGFAQTSVTINVAASRRTQIYVSAAGSDSNSGSSASSPVKTFARATQLIAGKSDVEVLFRAGDTFSATSQMSLDGANVHVTSYGSGNKPIIRYDGGLTGSNIFYIGGGATGATIENLTIDSKYTAANQYSGMPFAVFVAGEASTIRNLTFLNVGYGVQTNTQPDGVMVQGCDSPSTSGIRAYLVWGQGTDFVVLGNRVVNSTNEHCIRVWDVDRMLIAYNDLANPQAHSFETSKTCLNVQGGSYISIENNTLRGPRMQVGPLGGADGVNFKSMRLHDVIIENNLVLNTTMEIDHGLSNVYFRNNVFNYSNEVAMEVEGYNAQYARGVTNLNVINNTFINNGTTGRLMTVEGPVSGITLVNNIYQAPSMAVGSYGTSAIYDMESSLKSFTTISNNVWPVPTVNKWIRDNTPAGTAFAIIGSDLNNLSNYYDISRWNALSQVGTDLQQDVTVGSSSFSPNSTALLSGGERWAGVFTDYAGHPRPLTGGWSIGAIEA